MPFVESGGNSIYYEDSGGDGPALVLSHGAFLDHTLWDDVVATLSPEIRCITWDERGHGMTGSNGSYDFNDAANDAIAVLDAAGGGKAVFAGMSQGGWLSQRVALNHPDRINGLVLMGTSVKPLSEEEMAGYGQLGGGWAAMGPVGDIANAILGVQFAGSEPPYDGSRFIGKWQSKPPAAWADVWNGVLHGRDGDDLTGRLGEITCPALCVHGSADAAFPVDFAHEMSASIPGSRGVVVIEGGPHAAALSHPAEVSAALKDFVLGL